MNIEVTSTQNLRTAGANLNSKSADFLSQIKMIYSTIEALKNGWYGTDNQAYATAAESFKPDLEALGNVINEYGEFLKMVAADLEGTQSDITAAAGRL